MSDTQDVTEDFEGTTSSGASIPWVAAVGLGVFVVASLLGPFLLEGSPDTTVLGSRFQPPSREHLLGTDSLGRDVMVRMVYGGRTSLALLAIALSVGMVVGGLVGMLAGMSRGAVGSILGRLIETALAIPSLLIAILVAAALGPGFWSLTIAISLMLWARFAGVIRGVVLSVREREYVLQGKLHGLSTAKTMWVHVVPNVASAALVVASVEVGHIVLLEATLSFLGAGIASPQVSWGLIIADGSNYLGRAWWISVMPGVVLVGVILALNTLGNWVRDYLDPAKFV